MNDQTENNNALTSNPAGLSSMVLNIAASTYAYNKINNLLLMQLLAKAENRDLEEIRANVDRYVAQFTEEFKKANS